MTRSGTSTHWEARGEIFLLDDEQRFDVDAAKAILRVKPRRVVMTRVAPLAAEIEMGNAEVKRRKLPTVRVVDLRVPIIRGRWQGRVIAIDGWHRIQSAADIRLARIPSVVLTAAEMRTIAFRKKKRAS
jgi:hypothetical protein